MSVAGRLQWWQTDIAGDGDDVCRQSLLFSFGKRQKWVTSWYPVIWLTETRTAWPMETQMSYNAMKSKIKVLLSLEPARVAAHVGATMRARLAGGVDEGGAPSSHELSTLWGEAGSGVS